MIRGEIWWADLGHFAQIAPVGRNVSYPLNVMQKHNPEPDCCLRHFPNTADKK